MVLNDVHQEGTQSIQAQWMFWLVLMYGSLEILGHAAHCNVNIEPYRAPVFQFNALQVELKEATLSDTRTRHKWLNFSTRVVDSGW